MFLERKRNRMELGSIIERVRKNKGLTIKEICGERISRSVYNRFVNSKADTSTTNLTYLLRQLNLEYDELKNFDYPTEASQLQQVSINIKLSYEKKDIDTLERISLLCIQDTGIDKNKFEHMSSICDLLISRITNKEIDILNNKTFKYLIDVHSWTHYELVLFNNIMFALNIELIQVILDSAILNLKKYSTLDRYGNESFRMILNAVSFFISEGEFKLVGKYMETLKSFQLNEDNFFERTMLLFIEGIFNSIFGNKNIGVKQINESLFICKVIGSEHLYKMNHEFIEHLNSKYNLTILLSDFEGNSIIIK